MGEVVEVRGRVLLDATTAVDTLWCLGGRVTFTRPAAVHTVVEGWAVPGLVDVHCHIGLGPDGAVSPARAEAQAVTDRDSGVLLIRDAGSPSDTRWVHGRRDLPRLIRAGAHLARPKRYLRHLARELADTADLPRAMAEEAAAGDGWVKVVADWIDRDLGRDADLTPLWPRRTLADGVAAAHAAGARVTAHTFATEAVDDLLAAGVDGLEHGTGLTAAQIDTVAARGVPVTPTLLQVACFDRFAAQAGDRYPRYAARMLDMHRRRYAQVAAMAEAGVRLLVGTDAGGNVGHGMVAQEVAELVAAGVAPVAALGAASWSARELLGVPGLVEGASADLVVYPADPVAEPAVLAHPAAVVLRGAVVA